MKKRIFLLVIIGVLFFVSIFSYAKKENDSDKILVLKQAQEYREAAVAVEVYLIDDILEVTIIASMHRTKPRVYNVILTGPRLGRMSPKERQTLYPTAEDKEMFFQTKDLEGGFIRFSPRTKNKKIEGTLTKDLVKFKIPSDKIIPNKRYQLWIKLESMQRPGKFEDFKFDLKDLAQSISQ